MIPLRFNFPKSKSWHTLLLTVTAMVVIGQTEHSSAAVRPAPHATAPIGQPAESGDNNRFDHSGKDNAYQHKEQPSQAVKAASPEDGAMTVFGTVSTIKERYEAVRVVATGYTAGKESTGKSPNHPEYGITYSGVKVRKDTFSTIAADPTVFPLGTIMFIPGYGFGVVADTGSAIKGNKIDLYFQTKDQVFEHWGKKAVDVYVIKRGDGKVSELMLDRLNGIPSHRAEGKPT